MKSVVLMFGGLDEWNDLTPEQQEEGLALHRAFAEAVEHRNGCALLGGEALTSADVATTVRRDGKRAVLADGPYAEATEQLGGFYVVETPDLDVLVDLLTLLPEAYTLEIRPVWDPFAD
jgi:hypothetical protein